VNVIVDTFGVVDGIASCQAHGRCRASRAHRADFLICASALRRELSIYTTDGDFRHVARVLKLALHEPRS
jgi:predicted nucleic acid-binding protein